MTAAVPDPRFRDQLAEALADKRRSWDLDELRDIAADAEAFVAAEVGARVMAAAERLRQLVDELETPEEPKSAYHEGLIRGRKGVAVGIREALDADALPPLVEARVQAAANQRAAEIVTRVKAIPTYTLTNDDKPLGTVVLADDVLAALASPASPTREAAP